MKRKLLAILIGALMVLAMIPSTAFGETGATDLENLYVHNKWLAKNDSGITEDASGNGWTYSNGTLTLNGYNGGPICLYQHDDESGILTIELVGENIVSIGEVPEPPGVFEKSASVKESGNPRLGVSGSGGDVMFIGTGTLNITGERSDNLCPIDIDDANLIFNLGVGGKVRVSVESTGNENYPGGIGVYSYDDNWDMFGDPSMISLLNNNFIERPNTGIIGIWSVPYEDSSVPQEEASTSEEPVAMAEEDPAVTAEEEPAAAAEEEPAVAAEEEPAAATEEEPAATAEEAPAMPKAPAESYATILSSTGSDAEPAALVTISGPVAQVDPIETPIPEKPAGKVMTKPTPKTGDENMTGLIAMFMIAGAGVSIGLLKRKFN